MHQPHIAGFALALAAILASADVGVDLPDSNRPTTTPATRPITGLLIGTYRGTVMDDDQIVPCVTCFTLFDGKLQGEYVVRDGEDAYKGTLGDCILDGTDALTCRFKWRDRNGNGLLTIRVSPDGKTFAGSWGMEIVQDQLVWTGRREPNDRAGTSAGDR